MSPETKTRPLGTLTPIEAAEFLGFHEITLCQWRRQGRGPVWMRLGNRIRYRREDLDTWLESQKNAA